MIQLMLCLFPIRLGCYGYRHADAIFLFCFFFSEGLVFFFFHDCTRANVKSCHLDF